MPSIILSAISLAMIVGAFVIDHRAHKRHDRDAYGFPIEPPTASSPPSWTDSHPRNKRS
jgi:hypothetical protein